MTTSYDLTRLDSASFEHMVNLLVMKVLGPGLTGFSPGSDGGRDGLFEGEAPYPSNTERWNGVWYIQSKFHRVNLSSNHNTWFLEQLSAELEKFSKPNSRRVVPDNYIFVTNIDPTGVPGTGTYDKAMELIRNKVPKLEKRFHIWGGQKVLDLLTLHGDVAQYYFDLLSPGQALSSILNHFTDDRANVSEILRYLLVTRFTDQQFMKLEQAGSDSDTRPGIQDLFTDLPFVAPDFHTSGMVQVSLTNAVAQNHAIKYSDILSTNWRTWLRHPSRARTWFIKGGPGQGKSTLTQFLCQIHRAKLILDGELPVTPSQTSVIKSVECSATAMGFWPIIGRVPVLIELRDFAQWYGSQPSISAKGVLTYLSAIISRCINKSVEPGTISRALSGSRWLFVFDGLDEVPSDVKDLVAKEIRYFIDDTLVGLGSDTLSICTSRPQGYSGQFAELEAATIVLKELSPEQALACATPLLRIDRTKAESDASIKVLEDSLQSSAVKSIMTTPLQSHIMAVVVRDGGKPPERKWLLFTNFYNVIRRREASKLQSGSALAALLRDGNQLVRLLHNRLGFELHSRAETSEGAQTSLNRSDLRSIVEQTVTLVQDEKIGGTVDILMEATLDRLVLVSTPESGDHVRFDIRPLQEFFAAEYLYDSVPLDTLSYRLELICPDSHWREVMHFLMSGIVESNRQSELKVAVAALSSTNEETQNISERILNRRLALGSLVSARLLGESVLEQDKRVRIQFKQVLEPLLACTDAIEYLKSVDCSNSMSWLRDITVLHLLEKSEPESIGAASILAFELQDSDPRCKDVIEFLNKCTRTFKIGLIEIVFRITMRRSRYCDELDLLPVEQQAQPWFYIWILQTMASRDWHQLGVQTINSAVSLLCISNLDLPRLCSIAGIKSELGMTLEANSPDRFETEEEVELSYEPFGNIWVGFTTFAKKRKHLAWQDQDCVWEALETATGFFEVIYNIFKLVKSPTSKNFIELTNCLRVFPDFGKGIELICRSIPVSLLEASCLTDLDVERHFSTKIFRNLRIDKPYENVGEINWDGDFDTRAELLLYSLMQPDINSSAKGLKSHLLTTEGQDLLFDALSGQPELLCRYANQLPTLFDLDPRIRQILLNLNYDSLPTRMCFSFVSFESIEIDLAAESTFLPFIVGALAHEYFARKLAESSILRHKLKKLNYEDHITKMVANADDLLAVAKDHKQPCILRAAAMMLYLRHPKASVDARAFCTDLLPTLYNDNVGAWFLRGAAFALDGDVARFNPKAITAIARLLELSRNNFQARIDFEPVVNTWREASWAPVSSALVVQTWK